MGNRSLLSLFLVTLSLMMFALVAPVQAQDGGMQMQLLLPLPNNPISNSAFPVAVQFVNPIDAQVNHYEATIDGKRFIKGDVNLSKVQPGQSYSFRIDGDLSVYTPLLEPGLHAFNIRLSDNRGRSVERQVNFFLQTAIAPKSVVPPTVRIISPINGEEIKGPVNIKVEASGATGIKYITVYINNVPYGITSEFPYTISWDPKKAKLTPGSYSISAAALDLSDTRAVSPTVIVQLAGNPTFIDTIIYPKTTSLRFNKYLGFAHPALPSIVNELPFAYKSDYGVPMVAYGLSARSNVEVPGALRDLIALIPISAAPDTNVLANSTGLQAYGLTTPMALAYKANGSALMSLNPVYIPMRNPITIPAFNMGDAATTMSVFGSPASAISVVAGRAYPLMTSLPSGAGYPTITAQATAPVLKGAGTMMVILPASNEAPTGYVLAAMPNIPDSDITAHQSITTNIPKSNIVVTLPVMKQATDSPEKTTLTTYKVAQAQSINPGVPSPQTQPAAAKIGTANTVASYIVPAAPVSAAANNVNTGNPKNISVVILSAMNPKNGIAANNTEVTGAPAKASNIYPSVPSTKILLASTNIGSEKSRTNYSVPTSPQAPTKSDSAITAPVLDIVNGNRQQVSAGESYTIKGYLVSDQAHGISPTQFSRVAARVFYNNFLNLTRPSALALASLPLIGGAANTSVEYPGVSGSSHYLPLSYQAADFGNSIFASVPSIPVVTTIPIETINAQTCYTIKVGDTLNAIAEAYQTSPVELQQMNPGIDFVPGKEIIVPLANARIFVDNKPVISSGAYYPSPYMVKGTAMMPMRMLIEAKGGVVVWLEKDMTVNAWSNGSFVDVKIDSAIALVNTDAINLSLPAHIVADRTMVPLSFLAQTLNMEATYNTSSGTYALISK